MKTGAPVADMAEQIKWWDTLDAFRRAWGRVDVEKALQMARECQHPDAQWLAALFPAGVPVTQQRMSEVMQAQGDAQGDDARGLFLLWRVGRESDSVLRRSAEMGYPPAQALWSVNAYDGAETCFKWARLACEKGDREGAFQLSQCYSDGIGCEQDRTKALELCKQAAEWQHPQAQIWFGKTTYTVLEWQRYHWLGLASARGDSEAFRFDVVRSLPLFVKGQRGRILHTVAPVIRRGLDAARKTLFGVDVDGEKQVKKLQRVVTLHDAMLGRAKQAIGCWSVVGLRCGLVKDVRVLIAKNAWEELWLWASAMEGAVEDEEEDEEERSD
jgi:hypothetical protein